MKVRASVLVGLIVLAACGRTATTAPPPPHDAAPVRIPDAAVRIPDAAAALPAGNVVLPGGEGGIGFDDLVWSPELGRVLIPAGRTGNLDLLDPATGAVTAIGGFSKDATWGGGHDQGVTSATVGGGRIYATDRDDAQLAMVDHTIAARAELSYPPDYVRFVAPDRLWVTQPDREQIQVFDTAMRSRAMIAVPGGPESLVISPSRKRAYTHLWDGETVAIDLEKLAIVATWKNGCQGSRGIALDEAHGWLMVGCAEGKVTVLDVDHGGKLLGKVATGKGVDIIAYAPSRRRLYVPGGTAATTTVIAIGDDGRPTALGTVPAAKGSHCAVTDDAGRVWVCDPAGGRLLGFTDSF